QAGEAPVLSLNLGALTTPIQANIVNDKVRITASFAVAREVGVPDLMTGLYVDPDGIVRLFYTNTHSLKYTTAAHLGAVVKGELDKALPWNIDTDAVAESLNAFAAGRIKAAEEWIIPAMRAFVDAVPKSQRWWV